MAGAPNFQSLDGAMLSITAAMSEERGRLELEIEETEDFERGRIDGMMYGEDGFIKFKVHTRLRIRTYRTGKRRLVPGILLSEVEDADDSTSTDIRFLLTFVDRVKEKTRHQLSREVFALISLRTDAMPGRDSGRAPFACFQTRSRTDRDLGFRQAGVNEEVGCKGCRGAMERMWCVNPRRLALWGVYDGFWRGSGPWQAVRWGCTNDGAGQVNVAVKYDLVVRRRDEAPAEKRESDEVGEEGERNERKDEPWPWARRGREQQHAHDNKIKARETKSRAGGSLVKKTKCGQIHEKE
ncbi:hypothetical protein B0H14DRAFT_3174649 [Mycena olivaceomarginata]|nr:hypothetical protein B0H14DRAFT_3174649 [Mycena olivaceomarginata]